MINQPIFHLNNIQHFYGSKKVLDIENLEIKKGSITGLAGPNGSGKTSLLKLLAFAYKPSQGSVLYNGKQQIPFSPGIRSKVTLLTQKPYLLKRSVFDNVIYGLKIRKDSANIEQRAAKALSTVGLEFKAFANRKWHELSGGEAQRVAMAARLILKPETLLLDEPIANVDTESARLIRDASIRARNKWGTTIIIASHDLQWLYSICDTQLYITNGRIFNTGVENVITGPFEKTDKHFLVKRLKDNQLIRLSTPGQKKQMAVIRKRKIFIEPKKQPDNSTINRLSGFILSMFFEQTTDNIMITIAIQDLTFVLSLTQAQIRHFKLQPGNNISIVFKPEDVEWI